jgi:hypothetical protein
MDTRIAKFIGLSEVPSFRDRHFHFESMEVDDRCNVLFNSSFVPFIGDIVYASAEYPEQNIQRFVPTFVTRTQYHFTLPFRGRNIPMITNEDICMFDKDIRFELNNFATPYSNQPIIPAENIFPKKSVRNVTLRHIEGFMNLTPYPYLFQPNRVFTMKGLREVSNSREAIENHLDSYLGAIRDQLAKNGLSFQFILDFLDRNEQRKELLLDALSAFPVYEQDYE